MLSFGIRQLRLSSRKFTTSVITPAAVNHGGVASILGERILGKSSANLEAASRLLSIGSIVKAPSIMPVLNTGKIVDSLVPTGRGLGGTMTNLQPHRQFHAARSKVHYMDFRYRFRTHHLRLHLLIIRRQKMKKHRRRKFRRKYKCLLEKKRLKREIAKEKAFRVELLTIIKRAEQFDPKEYALRKIHEINSRTKELTREERLEELKELIRTHRYQVDYIKPKHKRADTL